MAGLTGGIATGKSTVAGMFREMGAGVIDADAIARDIVQPGMPAYEEIIEYFGRDILDEERYLDREKLGALVFDDKEKRQRLESLTHPRVYQEMLRQMNELTDGGVEIAIMDVPLLFESGAESWLKPVILVYAPEEVQLARLTERDECDEERARSRISSQMPIEEKKEKADYVIDNSGSLKETKEQVESVWKKMAGGLF